MGDEFGGIGSSIIILIVIVTVGSTFTIWMMGFLSRRAAERRRRLFEDEEPLPTLFEQASRWASGEDTPVQEPPSPPADDYPHMNSEPEPELPQPDFDFVSRGRGLPTPDIDEIIRDVPKGYSEGQPEPQPDISEAREGEVLSQHGEPVRAADTPSENDTTDDDEWVAAPEPGQNLPAATTRIDYAPDSNELPEDAIEVLRVYRDLSDGKLIFHMKDRIFASMQEIEASPLNGRFSAIVDEMVTVEGGQHQAPVPPPPPPPVPARPTPPPQPESRQATSKKAAKTSEDEAPRPTIADQIQGFLQQRLGLHPEFAGKSIHIRPSIDGTVTIEVEGQFYEAVADIPDDDVRAFLQKTIQDWSDHH